MFSSQQIVRFLSFRFVTKIYLVFMWLSNMRVLSYSMRFRHNHTAFGSQKRQ